MTDTEQPHRYEGLAVKDLAAKVMAEHVRLQTFPRFAPARADALDIELRELGKTSPQASAAYGLRGAQGHAIAPLTADGRPLEAATRDLETILAWWRPGGRYEASWPGVVCEPGTFYGLVVWGSGHDWWKQASTLRHLSRRERLAQWVAGDEPLDRATELGVPPAPGDDDRDRKPDEPRASMASLYRLVEHRAQEKPPQVVVWPAFQGDVLGAEGRAAMAAARPKPPALSEWMVWQWPLEVTLPLGHLRPGVRAVPALAAENALLELDAKPWRVQQFNSMLTSPPPEWLIAELQKFAPVTK